MRRALEKHPYFIIVVVTLFFCSSSVIEGEVKFRFKQLEEIYEQLHLKSDVPPSGRVINEPNCLLQKVTIKDHIYPVKILFKKDIITNIGLDLFAPEYDSIYSSSVLRFIERELLYLLLWDESSVKNILQQNQMVIRLNGQKIGGYGFNDIFAACDILVGSNNRKLQQNLNSSKSNLSFYDLSLSDDRGILFEFRFPARMDLITGMDVAELEDELAGIITDLQESESKEEILAPAPGSLEHCYDSVYVLKRHEPFYNFNSCIYYQILRGEMVPVNDPRYISETVSNLFQLSHFGSRDSIELNLNKYGNKVRAIHAGLNRLMDFLGGEHKIFVHSITNNNDSIDITLLAVNFEMNYLHLIFTKVPVSFLTPVRDHLIKAEMYSYIRMDNVADIFSRYKEGKATYKIRDVK